MAGAARRPTLDPARRLFPIVAAPVVVGGAPSVAPTSGGAAACARGAQRRLNLLHARRRYNTHMSTRPTSWIEWYRFARDILGYGHEEAVAYANVRHVEESNRTLRRTRVGKP